MEVHKVAKRIPLQCDRCVIVQCFERELLDERVSNAMRCIGLGAKSFAVLAIA